MAATGLEVRVSMGLFKIEIWADGDVMVVAVLPVALRNGECSRHFCCDVEKYKVVVGMFRGTDE